MKKDQFKTETGPGVSRIAAFSSLFCILLAQGCKDSPESSESEAADPQVTAADTIDAEVINPVITKSMDSINFIIYGMEEQYPFGIMEIDPPQYFDVYHYTGDAHFHGGQQSFAASATGSQYYYSGIMKYYSGSHAQGDRPYYFPFLNMNLTNVNNQDAVANPALPDNHGIHFKKAFKKYKIPSDLNSNGTFTKMFNVWAVRNRHSHGSFVDTELPNISLSTAFPFYAKEV